MNDDIRSHQAAAPRTRTSFAPLLRRSAHELDVMGAALLARMRGVPPSAEAAIFRDCTLRELQEICQQGTGGVELAGGTSDFPLLLADVLEKRALEVYEMAAPPYRRLSRAVPLADFRPHQVVMPGDFPALRKVAEHTAFSFGSMAEGGETLLLATYGRIFPLSRRAIVNDDVGSLEDLAQAAAAAVIEAENRVFFGLLLGGTGANGPTLRDGVQLFDAAHGNLMAGAALDATSLGAALAAMRKQTTADGAVLNLEPRLLLVGPDLEVTARKVVADITAPSERALEVVVDAHLTGASWYVFAAPAARPAMLRGYRSTGGPRVLSRNGFEADDVEFKVATDFGVAPGDWRAAVKNPGS